MTSKAKEGLPHRFDLALTRAGLSPAEAASIAQVHRDVIYKATARLSVPRDKATRDTVARALEVSPSWLWYGIGPMDPLSSEHADAQGEPITSLSFAPDPDGFFVAVHDGRWLPYVGPGDMIYVTPSTQPKVSDRVFASAPDGTEYVGELILTSGDQAAVRLPVGLTVQVPLDRVRKIAGVVHNGQSQGSGRFLKACM